MAPRSLRQRLEMAATPVSPKSKSRIANIPHHGALKANGTRLSIKIDCTGRSDYFYSQEFQKYREDLLSTLDKYKGISQRLLVIIQFPILGSQRALLNGIHERTVADIAKKLNEFTSLEALEVIVNAPEIVFPQIKVVAGFYGMNFKGWVLRTQEGPYKWKTVTPGSPWDRRLGGYYTKLLAKDSTEDN